MEMARNYWDEMGNGSAADVHTTLHQDMAAALDLPRIPRTQLPIEALEAEQEKLHATLASLGVTVSTGRVVDFRLKNALRWKPEHGTVPLLYPCAPKRKSA